MSVVIKKVGNNEYAYLAYRRGGKVVQKYLGAVADSKVRRMIANIEAEKSVPRRFRSLFWDTDLSKITVRNNASYIIERVLELGGLGAVRWIQKMYPTRQIVETCESSRKISDKSKNFWRIWFGDNNLAQ